MDRLINKEDFTSANLVKFSQNIREDQLDPYIQAAQEYDLEPRLGAELLTDLVAQRSETPPARPELLAFLPLVVRYLVLATYQRFLAGHGSNITQFGMTKTRDPQGTMEALDPQERAILLRQNANDVKVSLSRMVAPIWIFDGVNYTDDKTDISSQGQSYIRAPKRSRKMKYRNYLNPYNGLY